MTAERMAKLRAALEEELAPLALDISDDSAAHAGHAGAREGGHFRVSLVSAAFRGRPQIERHRLVYAAVALLMHGEVHALNIRALSPEEVT
jgi:BolA protein